MTNLTLTFWLSLGAVVWASCKLLDALYKLLKLDDDIQDQLYKLEGKEK